METERFHTDDERSGLSYLPPTAVPFPLDRVDNLTNSLPGDERSIFWGTTDRRVVLQGGEVRRVRSRASGGRGEALKSLLQAAL